MLADLDARVAAWVPDLTCAADPVRRRALAKAITLLESTREDHRVQADALLDALLPHAGGAFRIGLSGVPGVGKSTFIEALGLHLIGLGHRVAVLAVDPSSAQSGGSILGDKTRMEHLSVHERAFVRPSPSSGTLGGVAEKTREAMLACEAAGHDVVIVETVGVGQSEITVAGMVDLFVLMQLPNAGDDLQAIKRGVMEVADVVLVNKADLDADAATRAQAQLTSALRLMQGWRQREAAQGVPAAGPDTHQPAWSAEVLPLSALLGQGLLAFWQTAQRFQTEQQRGGHWQRRRVQQNEAWMWERIDAGLRQQFHQHAGVHAALPRLAQQVRGGQVAASVAARKLLHLASTQTQT